MEEFFSLGQKSADRTDISLCIFPHLEEFIAVDMRTDTPRVALLNTQDVFGDSFFARVEESFGQILRAGGDYPISHLMDLPLKVEELIREMGMAAILENLGEAGKADEIPTVAVFIISGVALTMTSQQIVYAFQSLMGGKALPDMIQEYSDLLERLISEEQTVAKRLDQQELLEALEEQSPNYFTLWERRN